MSANGTATIYIQAERTLEAALGSMLPALTGHMNGNVALVPSTLERDDRVALAMNSALPPNVETGVLVPVMGTAARRAFVTPMVLGAWRDVPITVPGGRIDSIMLPQELVHASHRISVTDVVEVARHGPFVLDLVARYAHPRHRLRLVVDTGRADLTAEVASAMHCDLHVIALSLPEGTLLAVTTDVIAAELTALALAERCLGNHRAFRGPWEDEVVQRATELQIGVLLPSRIRLLPAGGSVRAPWADLLIEHVRRRLGIPGSSNIRP